jgi:RNA polymerase sigma-70 factor (ECF subfamily)
MVYSAHVTEETELVREIAESAPGGAREAEEELCRRLAPRIRLYGLRHVRDEQGAADLTQHVLLLTLKALRAGRLREPERLVSFVLGTCRMVVLDLRRGKERRARLLEEFRREAAIFKLEPVPILDRERLASCLERLPERERSVVILTFYDDSTGDEVAAFLGVSPANVRVIRHRALERLRQCMGARR